jgi:hypothetical protein
MMYRRNAALTPRPADKTVRQSFGAMAAQAVLDFLVSSGLIDRAERENRRRDRHIKRERRSQSYYVGGLNGERAMARRRRQRLKIEARRAAAARAAS